MEVMPCTREIDRPHALAPAAATARPAVSTRSDWQKALPVLTGRGVTLRELREDDAESLFALLTTEEVSRFISPPPQSVEAFKEFIAWTQRRRAEGRYVCFGVVPEGQTRAIGIFQVRQLEPGFGVAEWGFVLGQPFWGTGLFLKSAELVLDFAFEVLGVGRLEARAAVLNGRGTGALRKVGAVAGKVLHKSLHRNGVDLDQILWSIREHDWRAARAAIGFTRTAFLLEAVFSHPHVHLVPRQPERCRGFRLVEPRAAERSSTLLSSRTLPGQWYSVSRRRASREIPAGGVPSLAELPAQKRGLGRQAHFSDLVEKERPARPLQSRSHPAAR